MLQPDGKILAVGTATERYDAKVFVASARLLADGTPDASFGTNGTLVQNLSMWPALSYQGEPALLPLPGGEFLLSLQGSYAGAPYYQAIVARFQPNGMLDATYGQNGFAYLTYNDGPNVSGHMVLQPDGKLILGGSTTRENIVRLTSQGVLDPTLVVAGYPTTYLTTDYGSYSVMNDNDRLGKIVVLPTNQVVLGGTSIRSSSTASHPAGALIALARYVERGALATVNARPSVAPEASIYPNPLIGGQLRLQFSGISLGSPVVATIYNTLGQALCQKTLLPRNDSPETLFMPTLPAGIYQVHLTSEQWSKSYSVVVL